MKIKKGDTQATFDVEMSTVSNIFWRLPSGDSNAIALVTKDRFTDRMKSTGIYLGRPTYACIVDKTVHFMPIPDDDGELIIRYWPPMQEI